MPAFTPYQRMFSKESMMVSNANRPCPICASREMVFLYQMNFELPASSPLPRQYQIVSCQSCGMIYADSSATQQDYDHYYEQFSKYEDTKTASGGGYSAADQVRLANMADVLAAYLTKTDSIIDIGCANGGLLEALSKLGFKHLTGIDPSPVSIKHVQERGFCGFSSKISDLNKENVGSHQAIVISHVLEHVFDVASAMYTLSSLLNQGGVLYVEVPNASNYSSNYVVPYYYFDAEHINHFDSHALDNLARRHGFEVIAKGEKNIPVSSAIEYPAVYALFRKLPTVANFEVSYSDDLKLGILKYIAKSSQDGRLEKIERYATNGEAVILWGAGSYTQRLLATTRLAECNIIAIVDNDRNKQGLLIHSIPIQSPSVLREMEGVILISAAIYAEEIKKDIAALGFQHKIDVLG
ncbi:MAG: class I SAM-dependent methyltransferase [Methylococcaceae bacterium]|nr:class I SAM-dependent methyltransferase [Methylococcaceae bacterium]